MMMFITHFAVNKRLRHRDGLPREKCCTALALSDGPDLIESGIVVD